MKTKPEKLKIQVTLQRPEDIALLKKALQIVMFERDEEVSSRTRTLFLEGAIRAVCAAIVRDGKRPEHFNAYAVDVRDESVDEWRERREEEMRYDGEDEAESDPKIAPRFKIRFDQN
jgi:hypothetical protein